VRKAGDERPRSLERSPLGRPVDIAEASDETRMEETMKPIFDVRGRAGPTRLKYADKVKLT
jgi:hypothetical protein